MRTHTSHALSNSSTVHPPICVSPPLLNTSFHAAELYLKSYLRQKGEDLDALKKLSHYYQRMFDKAAKFGMNLPTEIYNLFEFLDQTDAVIEIRYNSNRP